ncbi:MULTISPECIES: sodium/glutamate symporter [Brucella/Ochrobactrum group]|uniref:sodium/glutamate symporter n=1 Tax=Brucella/Ochrobactrum group TaxID=2826938 RepID=UPI00124EE0FF|nr:MULTISPECIES: sodium/glutamate symporter [Brucella/Ochrobactrum group]KAB2758329.1 sodium/glutamate symporter [Brucella anthropi]MCQ9147163.1 sodium/glutamate symporter [Ochrobactrum sp. BTU2]
MEIDAFYTFTIAITLLLVGKIVTLKTPLLRKYSIPEPVVGGLLCTVVVALFYATFDRRITFDLQMRDFLLLLFFAGVGLKADVKTLLAGGRPLAILLSLAIAFILIQNLAGIGMATVFGLEAKAGLMVGSISLTGGIGTTLAWAPIFVERLGISNAMELGVAGNTIGLIAACMIGGPVAAYLIKRHSVAPTHSAELDIGASNDGRQSRLDYFCVLWALLALNLALILGLGISHILALTGLNLPGFVSCLMAGIVVRNLMPIAVSSRVLRLWPGVDDGLALISDLALGLFLTMALMGLQLWQLDGVFIFVACTLAVQIVLAIIFTIVVVFRLMGRDYEAVVMSAGFGGIALGSTATAIANMTAVTQQYGASHRAFVVVPLVCGFFIDIVNALIISAFVG